MPEALDDEGFVAGSFDPVRIYDAPMVALSQMFTDQASFRSLKDTFLDPASLSPAERDSFAGKLKESLGNNPLTNAFVDIGTNPFVWFMFITSPAAGAALSRGGKVFRGMSKKMIDSEGSEYLSFLTGRYSILESLGLLNAHQYGAGTPLGSMVNSASHRFSSLLRADTEARQPLVVEALDRIATKFGVPVKSLDPDQAANATAIINGESITLKEYLKKFGVFSHLHMAGLDKTMTRRQGILADNVKLMLKDDNGVRQTYDLTPHQAEVLSKKNNSYIGKVMEGEALQKSGDFKRATSAFGSAKKILEDRAAYIKKYIHEGDDLELSFDKAVTMSATRADKLSYVPGETPLKVYTNEIRQESLDPDGLAAKWLRQEGFMPLLDQSRDMMKTRYVDMFGKRDVWDATGRLEYDDGKLLRIFRSLSTTQGAKSSAEVSNVLSKELQGYVGADGYKKIIEAMTPDDKGRVKMTLDQFKELLTSVRTTSDDLDNYMSRNVWSYVEEVGGKIEKTRTDSIVLNKELRENALSGRAQERNLADPFYNTDDLLVLADEYGGRRNQRLSEVIKRSFDYENNVAKNAPNGRGQVMDLDFETSLGRYLKSTRNDVVLHIDNAVDDEFIKNAAKSEEWAFMLREGKPSATAKMEKRVLGGPEIGNTRYQMLSFATDGIANASEKAGRRGGERAREYIMGTLIDRMRGYKPMQDLLSENATLRSMELADMMANSRAFKALEGMGEIPAKFVQSLRRYGGMTLSEAQGAELGRGLTTLLYSSHLGFNLGSAMLNLMQPLMFAQSWMGAPAMIKGYGNALKQYFGYIQERMGMGLRPDPMKVDQLRAKHFRLSNFATEQYPNGIDLLDIRATDFELIDQQAFAAEAALNRAGKKGGFRFWASELPLKLFTHTEVFNRTVTGEAMLASMQASGRIKGIKPTKDGVFQVVKGTANRGDIEVVENVKDMVQNTQFGSDLINSPRAFQSSFLGIPWVRQFFTFPIRTLTSWTDTAPMIDQGRRTWGATGFTTEGRFAAMGHDFMRMMGTSAIVYELGKNTLGLDLSRGLTAQTMRDSTIVGPLLLAPDSEVGYNLPLSPALSIVREAAQALTNEDQSLLGVIAPRFVPGGIALTRALNMAPRITTPQGYLGGIQREFADWGNIRENGTVPIYRSDGSLLEYRSAPRTILGSLGLNSYMFKTDQELNSFLVKNRQAVVNERRKYVDAVLSNNMGKANQIKAAFEKRFKYPLSVDKSQMDRALQLREVPLKERMYQRLPRDFRPVARPYLAERLETLKSRTPEELDLSTAQKARVLPSTFDAFDPYSVVTD